MKLSTLAHGAFDVASAVSMFMLPRRLGASPALAGLLAGKGLSSLGYSLVTRYEIGLVKSLPMKTHLALDGVSGATLIALLLLFSNEPWQVRLWLAAQGALELGAAAITDDEPANVDLVPEASGDIVEIARQIAEDVERRVGGMLPA